MSAAQPHFSVIIPVYNRAPLLGAAIRSVLAQSCQDFEIVVVDDGSKDDPASVVRAFNDPRIRLLAQKNQGGGAARNTAIKAARGRFIAPLDSDDIFLPHHLESMKTLLAQSGAQAGYARIVVDRGEGRSFLKPPRAIRAGEDMSEYLLCERGFVPTITVVVERALAHRVQYDVHLRAAEDTDFAIRLSQAGCKFAMADAPGAVWKDIADPHRTSSGAAAARTERFRLWLEQMKPVMSRRAWRGGRGWAYAKMVARNGRKFEALRLYLSALLHGCYRPRLAAIIFLQIFLNDGQYRRLADQAIGWLKLGAGGAEKSLPSLEKA
jgi:glycosyltransferase involved in cell wall biosynthesis